MLSAKGINRKAKANKRQGYFDARFKAAQRVKFGDLASERKFSSRKTGPTLSAPRCQALGTAKRISRSYRMQTRAVKCAPTKTDPSKPVRLF